MNKLAILIPTYHRSNRFAQIVKNIDRFTKQTHTIYFIVEDSDTDSIEEAAELGLNIIVSDQGSYRAAINLGYKMTQEPFLLLGSDDIVFTPGWDSLMIEKMEDPKIGVVGGIDDWPISKTGFHGSHLLIRRTYIESFSGVEDEENVIYSSAYEHFMTDIETEQTAMKRGAYAQSQAVINHPHPCQGTAKNDATYKIEQPKSKKDEEAYNQRRKNFEQYYIEDLQGGVVTKVIRPKLSVVIPSYNATEYLKQTIESLYENTYNDFELIITDDNSDLGTIKFIHDLPQTNIFKVYSKVQQFFVKNVNKGVLRANGEFIGVINNDITFSPGWDQMLIDEFSDPDVFISSPYQTDQGVDIKYGDSDRTGYTGVRGSCFVMSKQAVRELFPMPEELKMWCSDNWIVWKTHELGKKSVFSPKAVINHSGSKSSQLMPPKKFWSICYEDIVNYEKMTGTDMGWLKKITLPQVVG